MVNSPVNDNLSFGLRLPAVVTESLIPDAVARLLGKRVARPAFANITGPCIPKHRCIIDLKSRSHVAQIVGVLAGIKLLPASFAVYGVRDWPALRVVSVVDTIGHTIELVSGIESDARKQLHEIRSRAIHRAGV